jgi:hypothetical protein
MAKITKKLSARKVLAAQFAASKGGNVAGITEDHRYEMLQAMKALPPAPQLRAWSLPIVEFEGTCSPAGRT